MRYPPVQRELFARRPPRPAPSQATPPSAPWQLGVGMVRRRLGLMLLVASAGVAGGLVSHYALAAKYEAVASVEVQQPPSPVRFGGTPPPSSFDSDPSTLLQTVAEELANRQRMGQVAGALGAALIVHTWRRPSRWPRPRPQAGQVAMAAERQLQVAVIPHSRLVELRFTAPRPELAAEYLRRLLGQYIAATQARQREEAVVRVAALRSEVDAERAEVEAAQHDLLLVAKRYGLANPASELALATQRWQQLASAATAAKIAGVQQASELHHGLAQAPAATADSAASATPALLEAKRADLAAEIGRLAAQYRPEAAPLRQAQQQLAALDASLAAYQRQNLDLARQWLAAEQEQTQNLDAALGGQGRRQLALQGALNEYDLADRRLLADQATYSDLLTLWQQASTEASVTTPTLRVDDPPAASAQPMGAGWGTALAYSMLLGVGLAGLAAWIREQTNDALFPYHAPALGVELLGLLPTDSLARGPAFERALDGCTAALLLAQADAGIRVVQVTSVAEGEGKTNVSLQLARTLSGIAGAVLVLDANSDHPGLCRQDRDDPSPGLAELLAGTATVEQALRRWPGDPAPWFLGAGESAGGEGAGYATRLASGAMADLLAAARLRFDWVIVDGGALSAGPETAIWASLADCTLVVAEHGRSSRRRLRRGLAHLGGAGASRVGLLLNRAPVARSLSPEFPWLAAPARLDSEVAPLRQLA